MSHSPARLTFLGATRGLATGKPMDIGLATWASVKAKIAVLPVDVTPVALLGAAFLCGTRLRAAPTRVWHWRLGGLRLRSADRGADAASQPACGD